MKLLIKVAEHPVSVLMIHLAVLLFGAVSLLKLDIELLPDLTLPQAQIITEYGQIPATEVEQLITLPLENVLSSVQGVKEIHSTSKQGLSSISLRFAWGTEIGQATVEIREKIDSAYPYLPHEVKKPVVFSQEVANEPFMRLAVFPRPGTTFSEVSRIVQKDLKTRLLQIEGVGYLRTVGAPEPEIQVNVDGEKLYTAGIPVSIVAESIGTAVFEYPVGRIVEQEREYLIKADTGIKSLRDLEGVPLQTGKGSAGLTLGDVASVQAGLKKRVSFFHLNGREAIGLFIYKAGGAGTYNASRNLRKNLPPLSRLFARELELVLIEDAADEIRNSISGLLVAIGVGIAAAFSVLFLFFRNRRLPPIVVAAIPLSMAWAMTGLYFFHLSLNLISLTGIALGIGMVVDNAIVVLENLYRRKARSPKDVAEATLHMGSSTFGSTATTLLVFSPILFIPGITGALFRELALAICLMLIASFIISMTLTPALYRLLLFPAADSHISVWKPSRAASCYRRFLSWILDRAYLAPILFAVLLAGGSALFFALPKEILPEIDRGRLRAVVTYKKGTPLEQVALRSKALERRLVELASVSTVYGEAGFDSNSLQDRAASQRDIHILRLGMFLSQRSSLSLSDHQRAISSILQAEGGRFRLQAPESILKQLLGGGEQLTLRLSGPVRPRLLAQARSVIEEAEARYLLAAYQIDTDRESPELVVLLSRDSLAYSDLLPADVLRDLEGSVKGRVVARLETDEVQTDIRVRLHPDQTDRQEDLKRLKIMSRSGFLDLASLGEISSRKGYSEIHRYNRHNAVKIVFYPAPDRREALQSYLASSQNEQSTLVAESALKSNLKEIAVVFGLAVLLMYLVLGAQFGSFRLPILLLLTLPPALTGSLIFLYLFGYSLNISSILGMLILLGTTINTAILLAASFTGNDREGILNGSLSRLVPAVATAATTIIALLPIALNPRPENILQSHTAIAIIGGLLSGTFTSLVFFPALYYLTVGDKKGKKA